MPDGVRAEILGGMLVTPPAPLPRHSQVPRALGSAWTEIGSHDDDDDMAARIAPFDAIELEVGRLFPPR